MKINQYISGKVSVSDFKKVDPMELIERNITWNKDRLYNEIITIKSIRV